MSCTAYEKFRREVKLILSEGENLGDEEKSLIDLIAFNNSSKYVLELVRELKEEGNSLFKEKKVDEALERYGYAGVILVHHEFVLEEDKKEFFDLALCLLLNLTACLSRKNESVNVGQICSLILDYYPNNVKALFRRAKAARNLGKNDLALWDLLLAAEVDPNNAEVSKEIMEVKNALNKDKKCSDSQREGPIGLGTSLLTKKKPEKKHVKGEINVQGQVVKEDRNDSEIEEKAVCQEVIRENSSNGRSTQTADDGMVHYDEKGMLLNEAIRDEMMSTANSQVLLDDASPTLTKSENLKVVKPKYRFHNRKKYGSFLDITKSDYHLMTHGRTLKYYNAKLGTYMEVRVVQPLKENSAIKDDNLDQANSSSTLKLESQFHSKEGEVNPSGMEVSSEPISAITSESNLSTVKPCVESSSCSSYFSFTSKSKYISKLKRLHAKARGSSQDQVKLRKRRKILCNSSSLPITNHYFGCRSLDARKRKCADFHSMNMFHPPRKKSVFGSCDFRYSSFGDVICNSNFNYSSSGSVSFGMAHGQRNRY